MLTEADTCRKYVLPALYTAGWNDDRISEQKSFTDGRIIVAGATARRGPQKRADYLLRYRPNLMLAVVEAKASYKKSHDGLQQAKDYAQILDLQFAYATNGHGFVEHDFLFPHRPGDRSGRVSVARRAVGPVAGPFGADAAGRSEALPHPEPARSRQDAALLSRDRHQPDDPGATPGTTARPLDDGHRHGKD